jgi:glycosyltransferase involved in cell wall biosynthesis
MVEPTFTIAMPAYNAASTIGAAIRSVLAQTRSDFELLVVDDGSVDDTIAVVARFEDDERVRLFRQQNTGPGAARNRAINSGAGRYISMLDSDDLWLPAYLETMAGILDDNPDVGLAYTDAWILDDATGRIRRTSAMHYQHPPRDPPRDPLDFLALLLKRGNFVFTSTTVRRSVLEQVGLFEAALKPAEDYGLWLRIVAHGFRAARTPGNLAVYRKHPGSLSTDEVALLDGERESVRLVAEEYDVPERIRVLARARLRKLDRLLAGLGDESGLMPSLARARKRAVRTKAALAEPFAWRRRPPPAVGALLADANADHDHARSRGQA